MAHAKPARVDQGEVRHKARPGQAEKPGSARPAQANPLGKPQGFSWSQARGSPKLASVD